MSDEVEDAIQATVADIDPSVDIWGQAFEQSTGRTLGPGEPDRRTPYEVERDNHLEDVAEDRAYWATRDDADCYFADRDADRYERFILGEN